jgi:hypothetical protein
VLSDDPRPVDGELTLGDKPGFGYGLNSVVFGKNRENRCVTPIW